MNTIFQDENYNKSNDNYQNKSKSKPVISDIETIKLSLKMLSINQSNNNDNKYDIPSISTQYNYFDSDNEDEKNIQNNSNNSALPKKEGYNKNMKKNGHKDYSKNGNSGYNVSDNNYNTNSNEYYGLMNSQQYNSPKKLNNYDYFKNNKELTSSFDNFSNTFQQQNNNVSNQFYSKYGNQINNNKINNNSNNNGINFNGFHNNDLLNNLSMDYRLNYNNNNSSNNIYGSNFLSSNDYKNKKSNFKIQNEQSLIVPNKNFFNMNKINDDNSNNFGFNTRNDNQSLSFLDNSSRYGLETFNKNEFIDKNDFSHSYKNNNKSNINSNLLFSNNYLSSKFSFNTSLNNILNNSINLYGNGDSSELSMNYSLSSSNSLNFFSNNIFDKENPLIKNSLIFPSSSNTTSTAIQFPTRPGYGKNGKVISIKANFYPILSLPKFDIHHYEVSIEPETTSIRLQKIYQKWEEENQNTNLKNLNLIFDGKKNIYTSKPLPFTSPITSFYVEYSDYYDKIAEKDNSQNGNIKKYKITIKKVENINMSSLTDFLNGKSKEVPVTAINALDILLRYHQSSIYTNIGKCFYTSEESTSISNGAQLWKGFYQSIHPTSGRMMINLDVSATAFYESGPVLEVVAHILGYSSSKDLTHSFSEHDRLRVEKTIKGIKVVITHRNEQKRKYKVSRVTYYSANNTMFPYGESNTEISVTEYFKTRYNYKLKFGHLPCLIVGDPNRHIYLPLEVCEVAPAQRLCRKLNERQTADMIRFTCQPPHKRSHKISNTMSILNKENSNHLKDFNIKIGSEMAVIKARILDPPLISYHPLSSEPEFLPIEGSWNLKDKKVAEGATLESWSVVVFGSENCFSLYQVKKFISQLINTCEETGVKVIMTQPPIFYANMQVDVQTTLWNAFYKAGNMSYVRPQLILCILSNTGVPLYADIKRVGDTVIGISTQCIQGKHIMSIKRQYCANVCLKINAKLGGMNSYLSKHQLPFVNEEPTILFGANVTHPSANNSNGLSIAAMVGTIDGYCSRYAATISIQTNHQEIIQNLTEMVKNLVHIYYQTTNQKPKRIIFYRDNAPDNQFKEIVQAETDMIKKAFQLIDINVIPKITYVMVQKRHHCRFFPIHKNDSDQYGNILPGTVVDTGIIHPNEFDFYLCSHPGLQGTSKPTHYHILLDENNFIPDTFQELTYRLCYLYCRATKSVSVCPPAYYAHLVAARARFHIYTPNNSNNNRNSKIFNKNNQNQYGKQKNFYNGNSNISCMNGMNNNYNGNMNMNPMNPNNTMNMNGINPNNNMGINPMNPNNNLNINPMNINMNGNINPNLNTIINPNNSMMNSNMNMNMNIKSGITNNLNSAMTTGIVNNANNPNTNNANNGNAGNNSNTNGTNNGINNTNINSNSSSTQSLYKYNFNSSSSLFNYSNSNNMKSNVSLNENDFNKSSYHSLDFLNLNDMSNSFMNNSVNSLNSLNGSSNTTTATNSKNGSNVFLLNDSSIFNLNKFNSSFKGDLGKEVFEDKGIPVKLNTNKSNNNSFYSGENQQQPIGTGSSLKNNSKKNNSIDFMKTLDMGNISGSSSSSTLQNPASSSSSINSCVSNPLANSFTSLKTNSTSSSSSTASITAANSIINTSSSIPNSISSSTISTSSVPTSTISSINNDGSSGSNSSNNITNCSSEESINNMMDKTEKIYEPFSTSINDFNKSFYSSSLTNKVSQMNLNSSLTESPLENYSISSLNKINNSNKFMIPSTTPSNTSTNNTIPSSTSITTTATTTAGKGLNNITNMSKINSGNNSSLNLNLNLNNTTGMNNLTNKSNDNINTTSNNSVNNNNINNNDNINNINNSIYNNTESVINNNNNNNNNNNGVNNNNNNLLNKLNNNQFSIFNPLGFDSKSSTDLFNSNDKLNIISNKYNTTGSLMNNINDIKSLNYGINKGTNSSIINSMNTITNIPSNSLNDSMMNHIALKDNFSANFATINNNNNQIPISKEYDLNNKSKEKINTAINNSFTDTTNNNNNNMNFPLEKIVQYGTVRPELERVMYFM